MTRLSIFLHLSVEGGLNGSAGEPTDGAIERQVSRHDGVSRPVEAGVDSLNNRPAEQDVYPWI